MQDSKTTQFIVSFVTGGLLLLGQLSSAFAADLVEYKRLAEDTIKQVENGHVNNIDQLIAQQEKLVHIGVDACNDYVSKNPTAKPVLGLITSNADAMKQLSLIEIEEKWHEGSELKKNGYEEAQEDHFGPVNNLIDAVIHPATTYIALNDFKKDGNKAHLDQVVAELSEVLVHLQYLQQ